MLKRANVDEGCSRIQLCSMMGEIMFAWQLSVLILLFITSGFWGHWTTRPHMVSLCLRTPRWGEHYMHIVETPS